MNNEILQVDCVLYNDVVIGILALNALGETVYEYANADGIDRDEKSKFIYKMIQRKKSRFRKQIDFDIKDFPGHVKQVFADEKKLQLICIDFFHGEEYLDNVILNVDSYNSSFLPIPEGIRQFKDAQVFLQKHKKPISYSLMKASKVYQIKGENFKDHEVYKHANRIELSTTTFY